MKPVPVLPRPPSPRVPKSPSACRPAAVGRVDELDVVRVVAEGERVGEVDDDGRRAAPRRCRGCWSPPLGGSSKYDCSPPMADEPFERVGALERHAGDVDRLGLDVEVDDEVFGAFVRHGGVVEGVAGRVGQARILELGRVGDELVLAGGQAGQEGQVDWPV